jgi:hypothetical protein
MAAADGAGKWFRLKGWGTEKKFKIVVTVYRPIFFKELTAIYRRAPT